MHRSSTLTPAGRVRPSRPAVGACLGALLLWAGLLVAAPYLATHRPSGVDAGGAAGLVYVAGGWVCHQRPERSYHPWGARFPVCARCEGIYLAAPVGVALLSVRRRAPAARSRSIARVRSRAEWQRLVLVACLPTAATLVWEWTTGDPTPNLARAIAGAVLGAPVAALVASVVGGEAW